MDRSEFILCEHEPECAGCSVCYDARPPPAIELDILRVVISRAMIKHQMNWSQAMMTSSNVNAHEQFNISSLSAESSTVVVCAVLNTASTTFKTTTWTNEKQFTPVKSLALMSLAFIASSAPLTTAQLTTDATSTIRAASITSGSLGLETRTATLGGIVQSGSLQLSHQSLFMTPTASISAPVLPALISDVAGAQHYWT